MTEWFIPPKLSFTYKRIITNINKLNQIMKLNCAIIDDEPLSVEMMSEYVEKTPFLSLSGAYNSAVQAIKALRENPVDLLFLFLS